MWIAAEDARSDVILAAAWALFGRLVLGLVLGLPIFPSSGTLADLLALAQLVAVTALVPWLLARYRDDVPGAFGVGGDQAGLSTGVAVIAPIVVVEVGRRLIVTGSVTDAIAGRLIIGQPVIVGGLDLDRLTGVLYEAAFVLLLAVGAWLLVSFLTVRARDAFRSQPMDVTEALRTFGMGAALAGGFLGLIRGAVAGAITLVLVSTAATIAVVFVADRAVPPRVETTRATMLTPGIFVLVAHVFATGGIFGGDLLAGLHRGLTAAAVAIAAAALLETRRGWAVPPMMLGLALWPTCAAPLPYGASFC